MEVWHGKFSDEEKRWLVNYSKLNNISMAEAIRRGISCLRGSEAPAGYKKLLDQTKGIWKKGDGLEYQKRLRADWDR